MYNFGVGANYAAIVGLVTALFGYWTGGLSQRWGPGPDMRRAAQALEGTPKDLAGWNLVSTGTLDAKSAAALQCAGCLIRTYSGADPLERITVAVLLGPAGPISLHDPDVCYPSSGYRVLVPPTQEAFRIDDKTLTLWTTVLEAPQVEGGTVKVIWGWNAGDGWDAPANARFHYAGRKELLKIQLVQHRTTAADHDLAQRFLTDFLPVLDERLREDR